MRPQTAKPESLSRRALRLWQGNRALARKWMASVQFLRSEQASGWILDGARGWRTRGKV
jgi:hypothetical protein